MPRATPPLSRPISQVKRSVLLVLLVLGLSLGQAAVLAKLTWAQSGGVAPGETVQTNPKEREPIVTATVPDNQPPTTPILISPPNGAWVTTARPTFTWEGSTDANGISHYQLSLDGSVLFDNIPVGNTSNSQYTLTYDPITNRFNLTPQNNLTEGTHTWKIRAFDTLGNGTDSATWTFTIDTQAPSFVLTQIGTTTVNISAQDPSTVPVTPIELTANEPLLVGNGEANSTVQVTLIIPGEPTQVFNTTISSGGNWSLQLGILPRGVVMTLNFLITDQAGNISVLNGVQFYIVQDTIVIPPASPSPGVTPGVTPPPGPPTSPGPSPFIEIPIAPPREVIFRAIQWVAQSLPEEIRTIVSNLAEELQEVGPISAALIGALVPIVSTVAIATQFGGQLSLNLILRILQALGLIPAGKPQGLVFDTKNGEGVPFAVLIVSSMNPTGEAGVQLAETVVTNSEGVYQGLKLPAGSYTISVTVQDYQFPTGLARPRHLRVSDFYKGEIFSLNEHEAPTFLVPVDPLVDKARRPFSIRARVFLARLSHFSAFLLLPLFVISLVLALLFPSIWNWLVVAAYTLLITIRVIKSFKRPILIGTVISDDGQPSANVIVRVREVESSQIVGVSLTDKWGKFEYYGNPGLYEVSFQKQGYVWMESGSPMSFDQIDARSGTQKLVVTLTSLSKVYQELGFEQ